MIKNAFLSWLWFIKNNIKKHLLFQKNEYTICPPSENYILYINKTSRFKIVVNLWSSLFK